MQINIKNYHKNKIINILKKHKFLVLAINANQNAQNWIELEQSLYSLSLNYAKICNNPTTKIIQKSIFKNFKNIINGTIFFLKPKTLKKTILKNNIINSLQTTIKFTTLGLKLNKKMYTNLQVKKINTLSHKKNIKIMHQLCLTKLKTTAKLRTM